MDGLAISRDSQNNITYNESIYIVRNSTRYVRYKDLKAVWHDLWFSVHGKLTGMTWRNLCLSFPDDDANLKIIYLTIQKAAKNMDNTNKQLWVALNQFAIFWELTVFNIFYLLNWNLKLKYTTLISTKRLFLKYLIIDYNFLINFRVFDNTLLYNYQKMHFLTCRKGIFFMSSNSLQKIYYTQPDKHKEIYQQIKVRGYARK